MITWFYSGISGSQGALIWGQRSECLKASWLINQMSATGVFQLLSFWGVTQMLAILVVCTSFELNSWRRHSMYCSLRGRKSH